MAISRAYNVTRVDETALLKDVIQIKSIRYKGGADSSAVIRAKSNTGTIIWEENSSSNVYDPNLCITCSQGIHVTITGSAVLYLYS